MMSVLACDCGEDGPPIVGQKPNLSADPMTLDFGPIPLGAQKTLSFVVSNTGEIVLSICMSETSLCPEVTRFDPENGPFSGSMGAPDEQGSWKVATGAHEEVRVRFRPQVEGPAQGKLIFVHDGAQGPTTEITLSGVGVAPQVRIDPRTIDFGQVTVDQRKEVDLVLFNDAQLDQPVSLGPVSQSAVVFGTISPANEVTLEGQTLDVMIPAHGSLPVKVWFKPTEEGPASNTLPINYCPTCSESVQLQGVGIKPLFEIVPPVLDFGTLSEGQMSSKTFIVRNIGNFDLTVDSAMLEVTSAQGYGVAPQGTLPAVLKPLQVGSCPGGQVCELTVAVTFNAQFPGRSQGQVLVNTNAWDDPGTAANDRIGVVDLIGQTSGPDINAIPASINFGTVAIQATPAHKFLIIENAGNEDLQVTGISLDDRSSLHEYSLVSPPATPRTIPAGQSITIDIGYGPLDAGADQADVVILSNDRDEGTLRVPVSGFGGIPTTCAIVVAPSQVNFGLVERGRQAILPVEVRNTGAQPCNVSNLALTGDSSFALTSGGGPTFNIAAGSSHRIEVRYSPTQYGTHNGQIAFDSDDPVQPSLTVPISGSSAQSNLLVTPSSLDFGVVPVTCRSPNRSITLFNTGGAPITISRVYLDPTTSLEFELAAYPTPTVINPGGSSVINIRYHPADIGTDTGVLFIEHSESGVPVAVPLEGEGQISPTVTDTFTQLPTPQADILFVVDDSCSMDDEQASLGPQLGQFLSYANSQSIDYQIAVTTTDVFFPNPTGPYQGGKQGKFVQASGVKIINRTTPNAGSVFNSMVTSLGSNGSGDERGLEAAYLALTDPLINTWNAGFLRADAALAVIVVSDEEDHSTRPTTFYDNFFRNIKGFQNGSLFSFSSVIVPPGVNPSCSSGGAERGIRYAAVSQSTGGIVESICTVNWGQTLANIGLNTFGLKRRFYLSSQPVPVTISVKVNGATIPNTGGGGQVNWAYDQSTNSVDFQTVAVPPAGATIEITYTVACLP